MNFRNVERMWRFYKSRGQPSCVDDVISCSCDLVKILVYVYSKEEMCYYYLVSKLWSYATKNGGVYTVNFLFFKTNLPLLV